MEWWGGGGSSVRFSVALHVAVAVRLSVQSEKVGYSTEYVNVLRI